VEPVEWIQEATQKQKISLPSNALDQFRLFQMLLLEWNQKINLISKNDRSRIVTRHFLESIGLLTVFQFPPESRILDLGPGGGFPGLPLKIARPDLDMVLVESTKKKVVFLEKVVKALQLTGVEIISGRIESVSKQILPIDIVVSRAVADLATLVCWSLPCLKKGEGGKLIVIKGKGVDQEIQRLQAKVFQNKVSGWQAIPYNPFSEFFALKDSAVVIVQMVKR
jgi:16S rRNA (guanine527-N7)-methyltransferase